MDLSRNHAKTLNVNRGSINVKMGIALTQLKSVMEKISAAIARTKVKIVIDLFALRSNSNAIHRQIERHFALIVSKNVTEFR